MNAFAIGLGDMKVLSSLNQSFDAEIALIDVGDIPLSNIKASLATADDYERVGLERSFDLNTLTFVVERNRQGRAVIHVRSTDRVSEPFLQLLIDLAWAKGQLFREYDVLLDPPDYQLASRIQTKIPAQTIKHKFPTNAVEKVPAQELSPEKNTHVSEPLEAAHPATRLSEVTFESTVPSVPVLQKQGLLSSQYLSASQDSISPMQPDASHLEGIGSALKAQMDVTAQAIDSLRESNVLLKEQLHSMRDQNQALQVQLKQSAAEMKRMHTQIELLMRRQGVAGQVVQPKDTDEDGSWLWVFVLLASAAGISYIVWRKKGFVHIEKVYQYLQSRMTSKAILKDNEIESVTADSSEAAPEPPPATSIEIEATLKETTIEPVLDVSDGHVTHVKPVDPVSKPTAAPSTIEGAPLSMASSEAPLEPISPPIEMDTSAKETTEESMTDRSDNNGADMGAVENERELAASVQSTTEEIPAHNLIEFETSLTPAEKSSIHVEEDIPSEQKASSPEEASLKPVRSLAALDTLLELSQTYIEMGDTAGAHESLKEVLEFGNKKQQAVAKKLMKLLDNKDHS